MTLRQMSAQYAQQAEALRGRLQELRRALRRETDPEAIFWLKRRIAELEPLREQAAELAELTMHYYERGFYRNEAYRV